MHWRNQWSLLAATVLLGLLLARWQHLERVVYRMQYSQANILEMWKRQEQLQVDVVQPMQDKVKAMEANLDTLNKMHQYTPPKY